MKTPTLLLSLFFCSVAALSSAEPKVTKLYSSSPAAGVASGLAGYSVAMNDQWIVLGEPGYNVPVANAGSVTVLSAKTGAIIRRITTDDISEARFFGVSVALDGSTLVVGAWFDSEAAPGAGAAYVFDVRSGKQLHKLLPADAGAFELFGISVGLSEGRVVVGCRDDTVANDAGAAYVFDAVSGSQLHKLVASDAAASHEFGTALSISGKMVIVGATNAPGAVAGCGAAYVFDAESGVETMKLQALAPVALGDEFGSAVSLDGHLAMVGASGNSLLGNDAGAVYFFDIITGNQLRRVVNSLHGGVDDAFGSRVLLKEGMALVGAPGPDGRGAVYRIDLNNGALLERIRPADGDENDYFISGIATAGGALVVGAYGVDDLASNAGCAYWFRHVEPTPPSYSLAKIGDSAPDVAGRYAAFSNLCINDDAEVSLIGRVGLDSAALNNLGPTGSMGLLMKNGQALDALGAAFVGRKAGRVLGHSLLQSQRGLLTLAVTGGRQAILRDNGVSLSPLLLTREPVAILGGASTRSIRQVLQNRDFGNPRASISYQLMPEAGVATASTDSGIIFADNAVGMLIDAQPREGQPAPVSGQFGQFPARAALGGIRMACAVPRVTAGKVEQILYTRVILGLSDTAATEGGAAPGAGGALFSRFLSEVVSMTGRISFRATLKGTGVSAGTNEGLWQSGLGLVAREGSQVPGEDAGVKWRRFLGLWPVADDGLLFHATTSKGTGLWVKQEDGSIFKLVHTGSAIRSILRVDVNPENGAYAVLVSLRGPANANQALLTGTMAVGTPGSSLRLPHLRLKKSIFVKSMSLQKANDASGAGGKGLPQVINKAANVALTCRRSAGVTEVVLSKEANFNP